MSRITSHQVRCRVLTIRRPFVAGIVLLVILFFLVSALLFCEYLQLCHAAAKASDALVAHGITGLEVAPCMRKFKGVIVMGNIDSVNDVADIEAVLQDAGIDANFEITLYHEGESERIQIWQGEQRR